MKQIGELTDRVSTWNPSSFATPQEFVYIDLGAVDNARKEILTPSVVSSTEAPSRARQLVSAGDVLVSTVRPNLNAVAVVPQSLDGATASTGFTVLRPTSDLHGRYLFHWVRSDRFVADMMRKATGASYPAVSDRVVKESRVPLPPLDEQRRIAAILDQADALRAKRRQALAHLDDLTQSIFHDMFGRAVWPTEKLGDRLQFLTSGSRGWAKYYAPAGDKFIRIQNVKDGYLNQRDMAFVAAPDTAEARRTAVQAGDVLLSITADLGRTAVVPDGFGRAFINQHLAIIRAPSIVPRYLADFLESPRGQREVLGKDRGATKAGLNFDDVRSVALPIPPSGMQTIYAERVGRVNAQRAKTHLAIEADDSLFLSLQTRAFRGEL